MKILLEAIILGFLLAVTGTTEAVETELFAEGFVRPVAMLDDPLPGGTRKFVVEQQTGKVKIVLQDGSVLAKPFLDASSLISKDINEGGLLGMAFHPNFSENRFVFIYYTAKDKNDQLFSVLRRLRVKAGDPNVVAIGTFNNEKVLVIKQPYQNHNGGTINFSPKDGLLYIGTGDGGGTGDPDNNAQNLKSLLGKILRILPTTGAKAGYQIPARNPFRGKKKQPRTILHYGLRNPWKWSFDRLTGDLFIGDVGQNDREEISIAGRRARALNFGWRRVEGNLCYVPKTGCRLNKLKKKIKNLKGPAIVYSSNGTGDCSVTGGYRYRGKKIPSLAGKYIFGDFCSGKIWKATRNGGKWTKEEPPLLDTEFMISSFAEDKQGELYVIDLKGSAVHKLVP